MTPKIDFPLWPLVVVASPIISYFACSVGQVPVVLALSALVILVGSLVSLNGRPEGWKKNAPRLVVAGMLQFVLVVPVSGLVANQQAMRMIGGETGNSIATVVAEKHLPSEMQNFLWFAKK